jgi:hypothetical protein
VQAQLEDIERYSFSEEAIALLRHRLEARLAGSTPGDQRFVLEAVGARVIVQAELGTGIANSALCLRA